MYAIIATGGKQYKVSEGDIINVEKLGVAAGETVTFDQVLAVNNGELQVGCPTVDGATVTLTGTGDDHMYYLSTNIDTEEHLDREVIRSTFSQVNLAFSPTTTILGQAAVDFRFIGSDELEVRIVQYEPTDFLVDVYNSRKDDSSWNREGLPMKGQYTLIFRFTRQ